MGSKRKLLRVAANRARQCVCSAHLCPGSLAGMRESTTLENSIFLQKITAILIIALSTTACQVLLDILSSLAHITRPFNNWMLISSQIEIALLFSAPNVIIGLFFNFFSPTFKMKQFLLATLVANAIACISWFIPAYKGFSSALMIGVTILYIVVLEVGAYSGFLVSKRAILVNN